MINQQDINTYNNVKSEIRYMAIQIMKTHYPDDTFKASYSSSNLELYDFSILEDGRIYCYIRRSNGKSPSYSFTFSSALLSKFDISDKEIKDIKINKIY